MCKLFFFYVQGFVVSDWEGIDRLSEPLGSDYRYCIAQSVNAGIDMVLVIIFHMKCILQLPVVFHLLRLL